MLCLRPAHHLGLHHRLRDLRLCRDGRLRPRHRHPVPTLIRDGDDRDTAMNTDRAGLGRQRDLAGAGRRRAAGAPSRSPTRIILPALYAPIVAMLLGADLPRRRLRVPLARSRAIAAGGTSAFCVGSLVATFAQGVTLGALAAGHRGREPRLCRRLVRLADAVQPADRRLPGHRLRACSAPTWLIMKSEGTLQVRCYRLASVSASAPSGDRRA